MSNGSGLSGGQKQRINIARAIAGKPGVLILDDSTSALDLLTDKKIRDTLSNMKETSKIIVSQRVAAISSCDNILVIDNGVVVGQGKHEELLKTCSIYQEIYETQTRKD